MNTKKKSFAPKYCPSLSPNLQINFTAFVHSGAIPMMLQYHFHFPPKKRKFDTAHKVKNNIRKLAPGTEGRTIPFVLKGYRQ